MNLQPWDLRDPAALIEAIDRMHPLRPGRVIMGLVDRPSTDQVLVDAVVVADGQPQPDDERAVKDLMEDVAHRLFIDRAGDRPPRHAFVIVVARNGRVVIRDDDDMWGWGLLYSNHLEPAFYGDMILVTEHGWRCFQDETAGRHPALLRV